MVFCSHLGWWKLLVWIDHSSLGLWRHITFEMNVINSRTIRKQVRVGMTPHRGLFLSLNFQTYWKRSLLSSNYVYNVKWRGTSRRSRKCQAGGVGEHHSSCTMQTSLPDLPFTNYGKAELRLFGTHSSAKATPRTYPRTDLKTLTLWTSFPNDIHQTILIIINPRWLGLKWWCTTNHRIWE